jgi:hypothetical protein
LCNLCRVLHTGVSSIVSRPRACCCRLLYGVTVFVVSFNLYCVTCVVYCTPGCQALSRGLYRATTQAHIDSRLNELWCMIHDEHDARTRVCMCVLVYVCVCVFCLLRKAHASQPRLQSFCYVRLHGATAQAVGAYGEEWLCAEVASLLQLQKQTKTHTLQSETAG